MVVALSMITVVRADQHKWKSAVSGNWSDLSKWSIASALPEVTDTIQYGAVGTFTITNDTGGDITLVKIDQSAVPGATKFCVMTLDMQGRTLTLTVSDNSSIFSSGYYQYKNTRDLDPPTCTYELRNGTFDFTAGRLFLGNNGMEADGGIILSGGATLHAYTYHWNDSSRVFIREGSVWNWSKPTADLSMQSGGWHRGFGFLCVTGENSRVEMNGRSVSINNDDSGVYLFDGGALNCQTLTVGTGSHGSNGFVQVRNGMLCAQSFNLGSTALTAYKPTLTLAGETTLVAVTNTGATANFTCYERTGATIAFEIPADGYRTNGVARAPLLLDNLAFNTTRSTSYPNDGPTSLRIACMAWAVAHPNATIPLVSIRKAGGDKADLEALTNGFVFVDVPTSVIEAGNAPVLSIDEGGTTLFITAPESMGTNPTPPEFTVESVSSGANGIRDIFLTISTYGFLSTQATLVELTVATNETFSGAVVTNLATQIEAPTPYSAAFKLPGCLQRQHYWCRLRVVNDNDLDATVPFEFTDEGWEETYVWANAADGHWDTLANWMTGGAAATELPHGEDMLSSFPAGSYMVTLDSDSEIRSIGFFTAGTLEVPRVYTFDLNGKTLRTTKVTQSVTGFSGTCPYSPAVPMSGQLVFKNGTFDASLSTSLSTFEDAELRVTDGATVYLKLVMNGAARLIVDNGGFFRPQDHITLNANNRTYKTYGLIRVNGAGSKYGSWADLNVGGTLSAVIVENSGLITVGSLNIGGNRNTPTAPCSNCVARADNGTFELSSSLNLGTANAECYRPELRITGTNGFVRATGSGKISSFYENIGATIALEIPAEGFADTNGTARAPIHLNALQFVARGAGLADFGATTLEITARDWVKANPKQTIKLVELITPNAEALTKLKNAAVFTDTSDATSPTLTVSEDGKVLYATAPVWPGFIMLFY